MPLTRANATVELADGSILEVRILNPDKLRYEKTAAVHGWPVPTVKDGAVAMNNLRFQQTFEIWAALTRTDQYSGSWEVFRDKDCVDFDVDEDEAVAPFRPDPEPD